MANVFILCFVAFVCYGSVYTDDSHGEIAVNFDKETFDAAVETERLFVMFFAPW